MTLVKLELFETWNRCLRKLHAKWITSNNLGKFKTKTSKVQQQWDNMLHYCPRSEVGKLWRADRTRPAGQSHVHRYKYVL